MRTRTARGLALVLLLAVGAASAQLGPEETVQQALQSLRGDEIQVQIPIDLSIYGSATLFIDGFAFCLPSDPTAGPVAEPVPPQNIYGCINTATVALTPEGTPSRWNMTLEVPTLFLDCRTERTLGSGEGYITGVATLGVVVDLIDQDDCTRVALVPGTTTVGVSDLDGEFSDVAFQIAWMVFARQVENAMADLAGEFEPLLENVLALANDELCPDVPTEAAGFGQIKSWYR